jgi:Effector Associated Constant Component 1
VPFVVKLAVGEDIADLAAWLEAEDELRGHVRREPAAVPDGALGATIAQLALSLGSGSAATAMASVIIAWLRRRTGSVSVRLTRPDGSTMELQAERVRALDTAAFQAQVAQVVAAVWPVLEPDPVGGEPDDGA